MTIEEARAKKHDAEERIGEIINNFVDETKLDIERINIEMIEVAMVPGRKRLYQGVELNVKLI